MTFRNYCQVSVTVCHKYHLSFRRCTKQNSITKATNGRSFQLTPLFLACWAKKPEAALILLEEGADPNILALQTFTGGEQVEMSPLYAAEGPKMDEVRDALFENGADGFLKTSSLQYLPTWPKWVLEQRGCQNQ